MLFEMKIQVVKSLCVKLYDVEDHLAGLLHALDPLRRESTAESNCQPRQAAAGFAPRAAVGHKFQSAAAPVPPKGSGSISAAAPWGTAVRLYILPAAARQFPPDEDSVPLAVLWGTFS